MAEAEVIEANENTGGSSKKMIIVVGAILLLEAAVIIGVMMFVGGPAAVEASPGMGEMAMNDDEKIVEVLVVDAKLPNAKRGVTYLYNTEVYVQVKQKHVDRVQQQLDQFHNEIRAELAAIWRTSEPHHFQEPKLENLTRKVNVMLNDRFGIDQETNESIVEKCVVVMGTGFRVDS